jgi:DNA transposition AAA+ family ATPase
MTQFANIHNLALVRAAVEKLTSRNQAIPGLGIVYAPPGYGKTTALLAVGNQTRAYYVQMRSVWTRKVLLEKILVEMDIPTRGTISQMLDAIASQLATSRRPLIIDEFDYCLRGDSMVELVRDLYEAAQASVILSGEELLLSKLQRWPRFCDRISTRIKLEKVSLEDARALAPIYCTVPCADDFLAHLVKGSGGSVRILSINLANAGDEAALEGWERIDLATWGDRPLYLSALKKTGGE